MTGNVCVDGVSGFGNHGKSTREGHVRTKPLGGSSLPMDSWSL